jgi:hypothetical protein
MADEYAAMRKLLATDLQRVRHVGQVRMRFQMLAEITRRRLKSGARLGR